MAQRPWELGPERTAELTGRRESSSPADAKVAQQPLGLSTRHVTLAVGQEALLAVVEHAASHAAVAHLAVSGAPAAAFAGVQQQRQPSRQVSQGAFVCWRGQGCSDARLGSSWWRRQQRRQPEWRRREQWKSAGTAAVLVQCSSQRSKREGERAWSHTCGLGRQLEARAAAVERHGSWFAGGTEVVVVAGVISGAAPDASSARVSALSRAAGTWEGTWEKTKEEQALPISRA